MKSHPSSLLVLCIGYTPSDYEFLRDHLISSTLFSVIRGDNTDGAQTQCAKDADVILSGFSAPPGELPEQVQQFRSDYPHAVLIRCIFEKTLDSGLPIYSSLFDGDFQLDSNSPSWRHNLVGIICQAIRVRDSLGSSEHPSGDIYRQIFEKNAIPMALSVPETGMFVEVNESCLRTLGYERDEIIGKTSIDLNLFVARAERDEAVRRCNEEFHSRDMEVSICTKDKRILTGLFSIDIIVRDGKILYLTTMKDITPQKKIETELKDNNRFIQEILSSISEGIIVYDSDMRYQVWNRYMEVLTGIPGTEILGKPAHDFAPILKGDNIPFLIRRAFIGVTSPSADVSFYIQETGKTGWVSLIYTPYRDSSGNIIGVIASVRDISERKKAEAGILTHEAQLRSIIDTVPIWIACIDTDEQITLTNTAFSSSIGLSPDMLEGYHYGDFFRGLRFEHHSTLIRKALSGREVPFNEEMESAGAGQHKKYLRGRYSPLKDPDGTVTGVVCVVIDITDLKIAQQTIESINAKLHLLSSITRHDILNSLTGVLGYLTCAEDEEDPSLLKTYVSKAYQTALLIQEQTEFTRDYQDLGVKEPTWQNAKTVFTLATRSLKLGDILVETSLDDLRIFADPLLERVIYNLVDNALRYGGTITRISSFWVQETDHIVWIIKDDGMGIAEEMKERIFGKGVGHNTGLGLFLAREILDITGLSISETGREGEGAQFEIQIPDGFWQNT